jgi:gluconate 2-dehydrogenase gamma chain
MADKNQSETAGVSRRDIFQILGAVPAVAAVAGSASAAEAAHEHMHMAQTEPAAKGPYKSQTFDDHQWQTVNVLCDLIIPADDRSVSASQAAVPEFIDDWLAFRTEQDGNDNLRAEVFGGLMWLDRESTRLFEKNFVSASADQQKQILDRIAYPARAAKEDAAWVAFFTQFRGLTVGGFFSSKAGVADLPYLGNRAVAEWKGCDPKVWSIIEERMKTGYKGILEAKPWGG